MKAPARIFGPPVPPEDQERLRAAAPLLYVALVKLLRAQMGIPDDIEKEAVEAIHQAGGRVGLF